MNVYFADYSLSAENPSFRPAGTFGWDPTWKTVEDVRRWAARRSPNPLNVEVFAAGRMLSQLAEVTTREGLVRVVNHTPNHTSQGESIHVSTLEVYVY